MKLHFSQKTDDYINYRPGYPEEAISFLLEDMPNPSEAVIVDVGAGTGISSRQLAERGFQVFAVEPDEAMIRVAEHHPNVQFQVAPAEATRIPDNYADLVTCFQAFHWFVFNRSLREFRRILKPSGRLALIWNVWDSSDPFTERYIEFMSRNTFSKDKKLSIQSIKNKFTNKLHQFQMKQIYQAQAKWIPYFSDITKYKFRFEQEFDLEGLCGLSRSYSHIPNEGPEWDAIFPQLAELVEKHHSNPKLMYLTNIYLLTNKN